MQKECPQKFIGTLSVDEFIERFRLTVPQIDTLKRLRDQGKLW